MTGVRTWFASRSLRERRLIVAMVALLALTILWGGIVRPVRDGLDSSQARYDSAVVRLAGTRADIDAIKAAGKRRPLSGNLADAVRAFADQAGFAIATLDDQGGGQGLGRVHLTIQSARPAALSAWLARLEAAGILVDAATLRDNGDKTIGADLVLKARAA